MFIDKDYSVFVCVPAVSLSKRWQCEWCTDSACGQDTSEQALMLPLFRVGIHRCQAKQQSAFCYREPECRSSVTSGKNNLQKPVIHLWKFILFNSAQIWSVYVTTALTELGLCLTQNFISRIRFGSSTPRFNYWFLFYYFLFDYLAIRKPKWHEFKWGFWPH